MSKGFHHINANQIPPFQIPNKQNEKKKKVRVTVKFAHFAFTYIMAVAYTSLVTYKTTLVYQYE
jgi:hypothetical protein